MKQNIPESIVVPGHRDFDLLNRIRLGLLRAAKPKGFEVILPELIRGVIDRVILTHKTRRWSIDDLEKTEKTYLGTLVEIEIRNALKLDYGDRLDLKIAGNEVDIKFTSLNDWMIPQEAIDQPCLLVAADDHRHQCFLGLVVARREYLRAGKNRDTKKSLIASEWKNIMWILKFHPHPPRFWESVSPDETKYILSGRTGNDRVVRLFAGLREQPISRDTVQIVADQKDFMRRLRKDSNGGTRDRLAQQGILLLSGKYDAPLIRRLGLKECEGSEFISVLIDTAERQQIAREMGYACEPPL